MKFPLFTKLMPVALLGAVACSSAWADGASEVLKFSAFHTVETPRLLAGASTSVSGVQQARGDTLRLPGGLSGEALFVVNAPPEKVSQVLLFRNPANHKELKVWVHEVLPLNMPITSASFAGLHRLPDNPSVQGLVDDTAGIAGGSSDLQISKQELQQYGDALSRVSSASGAEKTAAAEDFWSDILAGRVNAFLHGGLSSPAMTYETTGHIVKPMKEIQDLMSCNPKIMHQFEGLLSKTVFHIGATAAPAAVLPPVKLYYECFDEEGKSAIGTGAMYEEVSPTSSKIADVEYFSNYGTYVLISLYEIWPIDNNGTPASLVWRADLVTSPQVEDLKGTEKMAGGLMMLQDVKQDVGTLRQDVK